jgi:hypothetical protein
LSLPPLAKIAVGMAKTINKTQITLRAVFIDHSFPFILSPEIQGPFFVYRIS